jgi:hypothetical protein
MTNLASREVRYVNFSWMCHAQMREMILAIELEQRPRQVASRVLPDMEKGGTLTQPVPGLSLDDQVARGASCFISCQKRLFEDLDIRAARVHTFTSSTAMLGAS